MLKNQNSVGRQPVDATKLRQQLDNLPSNIKGVMSFFVRTEDNSDTRDDTNTRIDTQKLKTLSRIISDNITAASDLRQITPYISKAEIIWKSLLLFPNGCQNGTDARIFTYDTNDTPLKNAALYDELAAKVDNYFTNVYKIEEKAPEILSDVMFVTGSWMALEISRAALDHLINGASQAFKAKRDGNESFMISSDGVLTMDEKLGRIVVQNKGLVRNPHENKTVDGLEGLLGESNSGPNYEFGLFADTELNKLAGITVTDNMGVLGIKELNRFRTKSIIHQIDGTESMDTLIEHSFDKDGKGSKGKPKKVTDSAIKTNTLNIAQLEAIQNMLMPTRETVYMPFQRLRDESYYDGNVEGDSISLHVPSNAVALVRTQNRIQGAYLILDSNGNFVTNVAEQTYYQKERERDLGSQAQGRPDPTNSLITSLRKIQEGSSSDVDLSEFTKLSKSIVVRELTAAAVSGQGGDIALELTPDFLEIMLARMFKQQQTRCLYVPASTFTYFAIQYNSTTGVGESLTEQAKQFIGRLAALDIADAIANLEASQPHNLMEITPEREDSDPIGTAAQARATWFSVNPTVHDIVGQNVLSIPEITDRLKAQSLTMRINGGENSLIPAPQIEINQNEKVGFKPVDENSRNAILNNIANTFGLQRSWLDTSEDSNNFAIEVLVDHEMLRNRTVMLSNLFARHFTDLVRKHTRVSNTLLRELIETIKKASCRKPDHGEMPKGDDKEVIGAILRDFMHSIKVTLPSPASIESTNKLKDKIEAVNALVSTWVEMSGAKTIFGQLLSRYNVLSVNGEMDDNDKDSNEQMEVLTAIYRMIAYKRYNIPMPFDDIMNNGKEGGIYSLMEDVRQYVKNGSLFTIEFIKVLKKMDEDFSKQLKKAKLTKAPEDNDQGSLDDGGDYSTADGDATGTDDGSLDDGGDAASTLNKEPPSIDSVSSEMPEMSDVDDGTDTDTNTAEDDGKQTQDEEVPPEDDEAKAKSEDEGNTEEENKEEKKK